MWNCGIIRRVGPTWRCIAPFVTLPFLSLHMSFLQAAPVEVSLDFSGAQPNKLDYAASASGKTTTTLHGKIVKFFSGDPNPQTDAIGLNPDAVTGSAAPQPLLTDRAGKAKTATLLVEDSTWTPISIRDVNLNLMQAAKPQIVFDQLVLETTFPIEGLSSDIKIDMSGPLKSLNFYQNAGAASFGASNTYAIPGVLVGVIDLEYRIDMFDETIYLSTVSEGREFETPFTLHGSLAIVSSDAQQASLSLTGPGPGAVPLQGLSATITIDTLGINWNLSHDVQGSLDFVTTYYLYDEVQMPEYGAASLLVIGVGAIIAVGMLGWIAAMRRRREASQK